MDANSVLSKAPIVEALGQLNFELGKDASLNLVDVVKLFNPIGTEDIFEVRVQPTSDPTKSIIGKRLKLQSDLIIQVTNNFISVSKTGGYEDWNKFSEILLNKFQLFFDNVKVQNISRLALRYINQFKLDISEPPSKYLTQIKPFNLSDKFQTGISHSVSTYNIPEHAASAVINQVLEKRLDLSKWIVTIDIDLFITKNIKPDPAKIASELGELRNLKNTCFTKLITQECYEKFR